MTPAVTSWHPLTPAAALSDEADRIMVADWSQVTARPNSDPVTVWKPNPLRSDDAGYLHEVAAFVGRFIPAGSPSDAVVLGDDAGQRVLVTTSHLDPDGNWTHTARPYAAQLPKGTELP